MPAANHFIWIRHWAAVLFSAIPYFYLSWVLLDVWRFPMQRDNGNWVPFAVGLMVMEFLLLHSGVIMAAMAFLAGNLFKRIMIFSGLLLFYGVMVFGLTRAIGGDEIMLIFASVVFGRFISMVLMQNENMKVYMKRSAIGMTLYIVLIFASVFLPVPELGITSSVLDQAYPDRGTGIWELEPERAVAMAVVYFFMMGLAELFVFGPQDKNRLVLNENGNR